MSKTETTDLGWTAFAAFKSCPPEVIPNNDLREHFGCEKCWCAPFFDGELLVHNSMDGREQFERGQRKVS